MKKNLKKASVLLLAAALIMGFGYGNTASAEELKTVRTITVTGKGKVKVKPNIAIASLGVQTENADAKLAQAESNNRIKAIIDKVKELGIAEADIQTSNYYMYPQYDYSKGNNITGYTVTNSITVTVRNIDKVGEIVDAGVAAGANISGNVQFSISDSTAYYEQALSAAIQNAKSKGGAVAKSIGVTIGNPTSIIEMDTYGASVFQGAMAEKGVAGDVVSSMPVQIGELEVTATVQATFQY